ncbi:MAG: UDP-N-acetylmuramoyl-L-alanyl-D-glutamate--2,6-diaminopimelate ligase [Phycisphaerales bacterium]
MLLRDLLHQLPGLAPGAFPPRWDSVRIADITEDSRSVVPGSLFIARKGLSIDARRFIPDAIARGASAVIADEGDAFEPSLIDTQSLADTATPIPIILVPDAHAAGAIAAERFFDHPSRALALIGITGTNGKTTVAGMVHQILNHAALRCGLIGTVITDDGRSIGESSQTTPGAIELSQTLATMIDAGCRAAAIEASSHALHQGRCQALRFQIAVFTNLTGDHLDYHTTMDRYADAKAILFESLDENALAIINADDPAAERMARRCRARIIRTHLRTPDHHPDQKSDHDPGDPSIATATITAADAHGMHAEFHTPWGQLNARIPLFGRHNAMNALQATAVAHALGIDTPTIERALTLLTPARGRLDPVPIPPPLDPARHPLVLIDYAHTDDALRNALHAMRPVAEARSARLTVVFGCGGQRDTTKRPRMGAVAADMADRIVITSDNPRTERPADIIDQILAGIPAERRAAVEVHADRRAAIRHAIATAGAADVIVIAGKGHEREQILTTPDGKPLRIPFDDAQEAREALTRRHADQQSADPSTRPRPQEPAR